MRREQARWRLLRRFLLSYLIVFFVPVLLSTRVYFTSVKRARDAAGGRVATEIARAMTLIDDRLAEMRTANALMAQSRIITELFDLPADLSGSPATYKVYAAHEYLKSQHLYTGLVDEYLIFFRNSDLVLSRTGTSVKRDFYYGESFAPVSQSYEEWMNYLFLEYHSGTVVPGSSITLDGAPVAGLLALQSIPIGFPYHSKAVICNLISRDGISAIIDSVDTGSSGFVAIVAPNGATVATAGRHPNWSAIELEPRTEGHRMLVLDGEDVSVTWLESPESGWLYVVGVPMSELRTAWVQERNIVLAIVVLSLLFSGILAVTFSYQRAGPIGHTLTLVSGLFAENDDQGNELRCLERGVEQLLRTQKALAESNESLRARIMRQRSLLGDAFVERLAVEGFACEEDALEFVEQLGVDLTGHEFIAGLVGIFGFAAQMDAGQIVEMSEAKRTVRKVLTRCFEDRILFHENPRGYVIVLSLPPDGEAKAAEAIDATFARAGLTLVSEHGIRIFCATGPRESQLVRVSRSFAAAEQLFDLSCPHGIRFHVSVEDEPDYTPVAALSLRDEERLINAVRTGNLSATTLLLDEVLSNAFEGAASTPTSVRLLTQELLATAMRLFQAGDGQQALRRLVEEFDSKSDAAWRLTTVVEAILEAARRNARRTEARDEEIKRRLTSFINVNFQNPNLQISDLRRVSNYSETYLYRFFKNTVGTTFAAYLEGTRIAHAADLLIRSDRLVQEIAKECGYNSCHAFRRAFKRVKGVLPTQFRQDQAGQGRAIG